MDFVVPGGRGILDPVGVTVCFRAYGQALAAVSADMCVSDDIRSEIAAGIIDLAVHGVRDIEVLIAAGINRAATADGGARSAAALTP